MLGRGELRCIGATTLDEYRKYIEKDPALERRFQQVYVDQPSVVDTISILRGLRERYKLGLFLPLVQALPSCLSMPLWASQASMLDHLACKEEQDTVAAGIP